MNITQHPEALVLILVTLALAIAYLTRPDLRRRTLLMWLGSLALVLPFFSIYHLVTGK